MPMHELDHFNVFTDEYTPERIPHPGDTEEILGWRFGAEMAHHEVFTSSRAR